MKMNLISILRPFNLPFSMPNSNMTNLGLLIMTSLWTRFDRKAGYYQLLQTVWFVALKPCNLFNHHLNLKTINKFSFQHCNLMDSLSIFRNSFLGVKISNSTSPISLKLTSHENCCLLNTIIVLVLCGKLLNLQHYNVS